MQISTSKNRFNRSEGLFIRRRIGLAFTIILIIMLAEIIANLQPYEIPMIFQDNTINGYQRSEENGSFENDEAITGLPFKRTNANNTIWVINAGGLSAGEQFTAVSLQGIINRKTSTLFIIFSENEIEWLEYVENVSGKTVKNCTLQDAINMFSQYLTGVVVFDDNDELSINLATTYSGIYNAIMVKTGGETYGFEILKDTTKPEMDTYLELYRKYAGLCNRGIIANLASDNLKPRDYIIQNRMLCLNLKPGPFSWPAENVQLMSIIHDFAKGSTGVNRWVFGWFDTPSHTEEDYVIQTLSHYGVILLPCSHTPNLSLLQSINATIEVKKESIDDIKLEKKVYITLGFADGDSVDVMYDFMKSYWLNSFKNAVPIAWSVSPAVMNIAPIIMQYYCDTASETDSFIAGGSGLGAIFPDFYDPDLLPKYVRRSSSYDLNYVWLLNSYTPYETRYSNRVLKLYSEHYNGMVLDYGASPIKNPFWRQYDRPFVRSVHYMGDEGDITTKISEITLFSDYPLFLYITLYPWAEGGIDKIKDIISSSCSNYEFVDLDSFFYLINITENEYYNFEDSRRSIGSIHNNDEVSQGLMWNYGWILILTFVTLVIWFFIVIRKKSDVFKNVNFNRSLLFLYCGTATTLYLTTIFWVCFQNYWQWPAMTVILLFAFISPFFRRQQNRYRNDMYVIAPLLLGISSLLVIYFPAAILLGALGYYFIIKSHLSETLKTIPFSIAIAIVMSFFVWTVWALVPFILLLILTHYEFKNVEKDNDINKDGGKLNSKYSIAGCDSSTESEMSQRDLITNSLKDTLSTLLPAIMMALAIIPAFYLDIHIINLKMGYNGYVILILSILVPVISYPIGRWMMRYYNVVKFTFPPSWLLILISPSPYITALILVLIQSQIYVLLLCLFAREIMCHNKPHRHKDFAKNITALPIVIGLFILIPPMAYTVYVVKLPSILLFLLYYTPFLYFILSLILIIGILVLDRDINKSR